MTIGRITISLLLLLGSGLVSARAGEVRLTLGEALERAREVSAAIQALDAEIAASEAGIREAAAERRPELRLAAGYARHSNVPDLAIPLPDGSLRTIFPNIPDNWSSRISFAIPLYAGGGLEASERAARHESEAALGERKTEEADLALEVTTAYWSLVTAREAVRVLTESLGAYEAHLADARNRLEMGLAARNEVLAVEVERDRAELARLRADNAADLAAAVLARLLDLAPDARFEPADSLEQDRQPVPDTESLVGRALEARPERMVLEARLSTAKCRAGAARSARRPQLSLAGGYDYANPNRRILPYEEAWEDSWDVGVNMSFNIFDAGRSVAQEARFDASALALERRLEELDRLIRLEVTSRSLDLRSAESAIEVAGRALESAAENLRVARDRYREGLIPSSELLDAEVAMMQAGLERTDSLALQLMARAALERAVGE